MTRNRQYDHLFKYVMIGDSSVGKSCILLRYADDQFNQNYLTTIGVDFRFRTIKACNKNIKLQIWDTAGQERYRTITNTYYKSSHAVILVYDITSQETFESIEKFWLDEVDSCVEPETQLVLIGNKSDLRKQQTVSTQKAAEFARSKNMLFFEMSAKTSEQVDESFLSLTTKIASEFEKNPKKKKVDTSKIVSLDEKSLNEKKNWCC